MLFMRYDFLDPWSKWCLLSKFSCSTFNYVTVYNIIYILFFNRDDTNTQQQLYKDVYDGTDRVWAIAGSVDESSDANASGSDDENNEEDEGSSSSTSSSATSPVSKLDGDTVNP